LKIKRKQGVRKKLLVEADVAGVGHIKRWTTASSRAQAIFQVARELEKENPSIGIFLNNAEVTLGKAPQT